MSRTSTVLHVDTLSIEGGLFTSEWLAKVSAQQAAMQADADYGVRAGFNLREEIGFAWRSAQTLWRQFDQARQQPNSDAWGINGLGGWRSEPLKRLISRQYFKALAAIDRSQCNSNGFFD